MTKYFCLPEYRFLFLITTRKRNLGPFSHLLPLIVNVSYCHWKYSKNRDFIFFCTSQANKQQQKILLVKILKKFFIKQNLNLPWFFSWKHAASDFYVKPRFLYKVLSPKNLLYKSRGSLCCKKSRGEEGSFNVCTSNFKPNKLKKRVCDKRKLCNLVAPAVPVRFLATCFCWINISRKLDQIQHSGAQVS